MRWSDGATGDCTERAGTGTCDCDWRGVLCGVPVVGKAGVLRDSGGLRVMVYAAMTADS